jgi:starvation-inducible outer membrane lipoprotein
MIPRLSVQETVRSCPSCRSCVAVPVPTMAGRPSSRLTMAAWEVRPPWSVTMAEARFMIGTQSGSVIEVTRIEPSTNLSISAADWIRQARPVAAAPPTGRPLRISGPAGVTL